MVNVIQDNKEYLSDIDGKIGDGDHGINMNKGFTLAREELNNNPGNLSHGLETLSKVLSLKIGGSMGPLYGFFFKAMGRSIAEKESIKADDLREMLDAGLGAVQKTSNAQVGDKTLMDVLIPSVEAYKKSLNDGNSFHAALDDLKAAAIQGKDSTENMVSQIGRSSRLGERSKGVIDPGAASCCLILCSMAETVQELLQESSGKRNPN